MKIKKIVLLGMSLFTSMLYGNLVTTFTTSGISENGYEVSASGIISLNENFLSISIENTSENSSLLGVWFKSPTLNVDSIQFINEPWQYQESTPSFMSNLVKKRDSDNYRGFFLDVSTNGWSPALRYGEILSIGALATGFLYDFNDPTDMVFRWQQVGPNGEDSAKTTFSLDTPIQVSIPEPSIIGALSSVFIFCMIYFRRNR